ncbi:hypothetical protein [Terricaulis silvestris]|uniref:Uncharacterized protein n=1 Tax=Terricaulis silvestris TaxID=2686094 RepID=A0A6I6MGF7_9CAUL|nr:hypothetical protein [Terricaulis silvestris]QGZ93349.1 hypothetical protein DSM104635_00159 [Terricaulis silvestris]
MTEQISSVAMTTYRFFAVNELDTVMSVQEIECTDDGGAREIAESLLTDGCGIEVWDVGRRVC